ncbi:hypothetical protein F5Y14DRAFT_402337 [Nemania sp. NC0429]|nr:hypothetical protein F5Y14DRAFT_402337 [Nemania sp. NC0429]
MAAMDKIGDQGEHELGRPRYKIEYHVTSTRDDDSMFKVRRNGKVFYIRIFPSQFVNSPATTRRYMRYLELLKSGIDSIDDDIYDTHVFEWVTQPFETLFVELAPDPAADAVLPQAVRLTPQPRPRTSRWPTRRIAAASLDLDSRELNLCRVHGVVLDEHRFRGRHTADVRTSTTTTRR